jgi:branched-chain amino acid transport system substrate-binding protein
MNTKWLAAFLVVGFAWTTLPSAAEDGVTHNTILLGQTVGVTGTVAAPVKEMNEGANAYFTFVNKNGGVHGRTIKLLTLDDKFDPALTVANAETLIKKERVFALFLGRGTPHTQAILPILVENQVPLIAPSTGSTVFHDPPIRWIFNIRAKYQTEVAKAIEHFALLGVKRIGILHVDDAFGEDGLAGFNKAMAAHKLTPTNITKFARVKPDYAATAATVIKANPSALIIVSSSKNTIEVIKAIRAQGNQMQIMTLSNNSSHAFVKELGPAGAGVILSQIMVAPHLVTTRLGQEFNAAAKATGATISYPAIEGYMNAKVLVEGLQRAGRNLTREGFIRALESMQTIDMGGVLISYGEKDHSGSEFVELTMIGKDGRFIR